jgi:hypothetical protein
VSSYSHERKVLRMTRHERDQLLSPDRTTVRPAAPMLLLVRLRQADIVLCAGEIIKARRPWDAVGSRVPRGHGDVKVAIERAAAGRIA